MTSKTQYSHLNPDPACYIYAVGGGGGVNIYIFCHLATLIYTVCFLSIDVFTWHNMNIS